jgi:hypothetical protein
VWNPTSQKLQGTYLSSSGSQLFFTASVIPETANGLTCFLDSDAVYSQYEGLGIGVYDQATYGLLGEVPFMSLYSPDATDLVRWGSNGFAFRMIDNSGIEPTANQIVIVTSDLVTSHATGAAIPILASVSPSTAKAGGAAYTMQLTGSGFTSASIVLIDGNARATTYISGFSLNAKVLASDIAQGGQFNVQVTTPAPGGGTSDYVTVGIYPSASMEPLSASAQNFEGIKESFGDTAQTIELSHSGKAP